MRSLYRSPSSYISQLGVLVIITVALASCGRFPLGGNGNTSQIIAASLPGTWLRECKSVGNQYFSESQIIFGADDVFEYHERVLRSGTCDEEFLVCHQVRSGSHTSSGFSLGSDEGFPTDSFKLDIAVEQTELLVDDDCSSLPNSVFTAGDTFTIGHITLSTEKILRFGVTSGENDGTSPQKRHNKLSDSVFVK